MISKQKADSKKFFAAFFQKSSSFLKERTKELFELLPACCLA
jgi:hypothetical protein